MPLSGGLSLELFAFSRCCAGTEWFCCCPHSFLSASRQPLLGFVLNTPAQLFAAAPGYKISPPLHTSSFLNFHPSTSPVARAPHSASPGDEGEHGAVSCTATWLPSLCWGVYGVCRAAGGKPYPQPGCRGGFCSALAQHVHK